jgi:hypothetical protein
VSRIIEELKQRRRGRRWQRWSEVDPLDDYARRAGIGVAVVFGIFVIIVALFVIALVAR